MSFYVKNEKCKVYQKLQYRMLCILLSSAIGNQLSAMSHPTTIYGQRSTANCHPSSSIRHHLFTRMIGSYRILPYIFFVKIDLFKFPFNISFGLVGVVF